MIWKTEEHFRLTDMKCKAGDIIYSLPWSWHQHFNAGPDKEVQFPSLSGTKALQQQFFFNTKVLILNLM